MDQTIRSYAKGGVLDATWLDTKHLLTLHYFCSVFRLCTARLIPNMSSETPFRRAVKVDLSQLALVRLIMGLILVCRRAQVLHN